MPRLLFSNSGVHGTSFGCTTLFLIVLLTSPNAAEDQTDFFTELCKTKNYSITNPHLPESLDDVRSACGLIGYPDGSFKPVPVDTQIKPCQSLEYTVPFGVFTIEYVKKCRHYVYKVKSSPEKAQKNSIVYWRTMSDESDPTYFVAVFCKRGKVLGKYVEVAESLSDEEIHDLSTVYGIDVDPDEIDTCLEKAGACS